MFLFVSNGGEAFLGDGGTRGRRDKEAKEKMIFAVAWSPCLPVSPSLIHTVSIRPGAATLPSMPDKG